MKKTIYWLLAIIAVAAAVLAFQFYGPDLQGESTAFSAMVPRDAVYCIEKRTLSNLISENTKSKATWHDRIALVKFVSDEIQKISVGENENTTCFVSCHFLDETATGLIFYANSPSILDAFGLVGQNSERTYKGFTISTGTAGYSFTTNGEYYIVSKSGLLLEQVCRTIEEKNGLDFLPGDTYVNTGLTAKLLGGEMTELAKLFSVYGGVSIQLENSGKQGVTIKGIQVGMADSTAAMTNKITGNFFPMNTAVVCSGTKEYMEEHGVLKAPVNQIVGGDLTLFYLSREQQNSMDKIFISRNTQILTNNYFKVDKGVFRDIELTSLGYRSESGDTTLVTVAKMYDQYLVSESEEAIFEVIQAVDDENVWGKSLKHYDLLSNLSINATANVIINPRYLITGGSEESKKNSEVEFLVLQKVSAREGNLINGLVSMMEGAQNKTEQDDLVANNTSSDNTTSASTTGPSESENSSTGKIEVVTTLESAVITKPYLVRNHVEGGREIIVQTEDLGVHLLSMAGKKEWTKTIDGKIVSTITQIDRYKNRKLQFLFATSNSIHLLDRKGRNVEGFPIKVPYEIDQFSVVDYDGSKEYRMAVSDAKGNLYLYNLEGETLGDWNPLKLENKLVAPIRHLRIGNKDYLLTATSEGKVHVLKRNGSYYPGFPLDLNEELESEFSVSKADASDKTQLRFLTKIGNVYTVRLSGKKTRNELVLSDSNFLTTNADQSKVTFFSAENGSTKGFTSEGKKVVEIGQEIAGVQVSQHYPFNSQDDIFIFVTSGTTRVFSEKGKQYASFKSNGNEVSLLNFEAKKQNVVYYSEGKSIKRIKF